MKLTIEIEIKDRPFIDRTPYSYFHEELDRAIFKELMDRCGYSQLEFARRHCINRNTLKNKLRKLNLSDWCSQKKECLRKSKY